VVTVYYMHTYTPALSCQTTWDNTEYFLFSRGRLSFETEEKLTKVGSFYIGKAGLSSLKRLASLMPSGFYNKIE
jgi:hypothetical protein